MIAGVCNGLAAYFGVDPTIVRLVFVVLLFLSGGLIAIAYLVLMFIIPEAKTPEERAAARGLPFNAQELVGQAKRHYADLKDSHQRWRERRRRDKEREFWSRRGRRGYEPPHSRPFDQPQSGYGARVAAGIVLPLIGVVSAALTVACIVAVASLLATGEILGWSLPFHFPRWIAVLALHRRVRARRRAAARGALRLLRGARSAPRLVRVLGRRAMDRARDPCLVDRRALRARGERVLPGPVPQLARHPVRRRAGGLAAQNSRPPIHHAAAAIRAEAGIVSTQAAMMLPATPQRTARTRCALPTPMIDPVIV